jgi:hypothetical protein
MVFGKLSVTKVGAPARYRMGFHIDVPPPHVDVPAPHVDIPPAHVDIPPPHVDIPPPHVDIPAAHVDIPPPHVDIPAAHVDIPPPHVDIPPPHIDLHGVHVDVPPPHIDIPPPHVDIHGVHVDVPPPHVDIPGVHIDIPGVHIDIPLHVDVAPFGHPDNHADAPHADAAPPHVDTGYNHWWQNWPKTHAYIAARMLFPRSVAEIAADVRAAEAAQIPLRAVGGSWSFSEASLPGNVNTVRADVSMSDKIDGVLPLAEGFPLDSQPSIASIDANNGWLTGYDHGVRLLGGARRHVNDLNAIINPAGPQPVWVMNTRAMKSSLQPDLRSLLAAPALAATAPGTGTYYYHVEAGVTIEELGALLDAHSPRLQLGTSQGNPGATLAGSLSTATHGAEFNDRLLVDRVRAIHLVGPGGLEWWIEGNVPIASTSALLARYPGLAASRIISGTAPIMGVTPQNWLSAVVVSMGCMGVIYSVVLEVEDLQGALQVTTQTTWHSFLEHNPFLHPLNIDQIMHALENENADPNYPTVYNGILSGITSGAFGGGLIPPGSNRYADLAFNPIPAPAGSHALAAGDLDCWIVNRRNVPLPFDPQPPGGGGITDVVNAVFSALAKAFGADGNNPGNMINLVARIADVYGLVNPAGGVLAFLQGLADPFSALAGSNNPLASLVNAVLGLVPGAAPILQALVAAVNPVPLINMIATVANAHDTLDVALQTMTQPITEKVALDLAQPFLTGFLASALGTNNNTGLGASIGTDVGSLGFPSDGLVGAGLEVAMPVSTAFGFLHNQILKPIAQGGRPFYGYVSIRICNQTSSLLGMQRWPISVMMEVVSIGDAWGKQVIANLQKAAITYIQHGGDAMLHWGLENDQLRASDLASIPSLHATLPIFLQVRGLLYGAATPAPFRVFNNAFTQRLGIVP